MILVLAQSFLEKDRVELLPTAASGSEEIRHIISNCTPPIVRHSDDAGREFLGSLDGGAGSCSFKTTHVHNSVLSASPPLIDVVPFDLSPSRPGVCVLGDRANACQITIKTAEINPLAHGLLAASAAGQPRAGWVFSPRRKRFASISDGHSISEIETELNNRLLGEGSESVAFLPEENNRLSERWALVHDLPINFDASKAKGELVYELKLDTQPHSLWSKWADCFTESGSTIDHKGLRALVLTAWKSWSSHPSKLVMTAALENLEFGPKWIPLPRSPWQLDGYVLRSEQCPRRLEAASEPQGALPNTTGENLPRRSERKEDKTRSAALPLLWSSEALGSKEILRPTRFVRARSDAVFEPNQVEISESSDSAVRETRYYLPGFRSVADTPWLAATQGRFEARPDFLERAAFWGIPSDGDPCNLVAAWKKRSADKRSYETTLEVEIELLRQDVSCLESSVGRPSADELRVAALLELGLLMSHRERINQKVEASRERLWLASVFAGGLTKRLVAQGCAQSGSSAERYRFADLLVLAAWAQKTHLTLVGSEKRPVPDALVDLRLVANDSCGSDEFVGRFLRSHLQMLQTAEYPTGMSK